MTPRPRKSYDRQMPSFDEFQIPQRQGPPPQGMGTMSRSKSTNMAPRSNSNRLPPPLPEYRSMQPMQYPPGVLGMQNRVPFPPSYYNRPPPFPQFQQYPNFQPMYPWQQQQWIEFNNRPKPPQGDFRGHRRSKSHPQLRPLPVPPGSTEQQDPIPPQISKQQTIPPPQIIEQQIVDSKTKNKNKNNNDDDNSRNKSTNSRRSSTSSRYKPSLSPVIEQKSPYSQMSRSNSLPNLSSHEDLMRNELLFAPPVPLIPSNIQPGTKNNNKNNNKSNNKNTESQPPIIDNTDKFERFIKMYGNKDYNMMSENPQYNKYSEIQDDDNNGWNSNENNDYIPPKRPRPKSAHSVKGEASPKSSMYIEDVKNRPYNDDYYYYGPSSGYGMNQEMMNSRNNNYAYAQYVGPMGYNNGRNFVQNNPMSDNYGWVNYGQQRPQGMNYYY
ncbi:hypothetical protein C1645_749561 [Glomus cerebriforme]|uniref:Uncharacterized protein n=1 Tax=Glomus cerebriforme TaxID=658196 RepID=A0A397TPX9_9GLOM|nr:hypothetical protein C1645_749561 [Glomus cerebriforme]